MISWKYSFEKITKDLELARKKKQALDNLFNSGKISESTYGSLDNELSAIISDIELRQKILSENLTSKVEDLEKQISTLEIFLANSEIQYVAGEIGEELHTHETAAFSSGLNSLKNQLISLKEAVATIMPEKTISTSTSDSVDAEPVQLADVVFEETTQIPDSSINTPEIEIDEAPIETPIELPLEEVPESPDYTSIDKESVSAI